jgi:hypothetical protein
MFVSTLHEPGTENHFLVAFRNVCFPAVRKLRPSGNQIITSGIIKNNTSHCGFCDNLMNKKMRSGLIV